MWKPDMPFASRQYRRCCRIPLNLTICAGNDCRKAFDIRIELRQVLEDAFVLERVLCCEGLVGSVTGSICICA